jgi:hypothetical protein
MSARYSTYVPILQLIGTGIGSWQTSDWCLNGALYRRREPGAEVHPRLISQAVLRPM